MLILFLLKEDKKEGKKEARIEKDIGYIKECLKRLEEHLEIVEERYREIIKNIT